MAIGKNSRKSSARSSIRAPKFLDKSSGFYGRLDEAEVAGAEVRVRENGVEDDRGEAGSAWGQSPGAGPVPEAAEQEKAEAFDVSEGMMEDDGETLLQRKPSRLSSRWRRSSRRKQKVGRADEEEEERPSVGTEAPGCPVDPEVPTAMGEEEQEKMKKVGQENKEAGGGKGPALAHFGVREDADDMVLIRDKKRGREEEGEEERRMKKEQEEGKKMVKRNSVKNYRKVRLTFFGGELALFLSRNIFICCCILCLTFP